uniref:Uncharacterized protein n=1 Tax=Mycobacterium leprae TaxID=1769 RepID=O32898_MYCLR|nr:hypothetical protein MLCB1779.38 [Mycobacterium leprae]
MRNAREQAVLQLKPSKLPGEPRQVAHQCHRQRAIWLGTKAVAHPRSTAPTTPMNSSKEIPTGLIMDNNLTARSTDI